MSKTIEMVEEFHEAFDIDCPKRPGFPGDYSAATRRELLVLQEMQREVALFAHAAAKANGKDTTLLRVQLMAEELAELIEAMAEPHRIAPVLHEAADLRYVVDGTVLAFGLGRVYEDAVAEIHRANMSKLEDGKPVKDAAGRVTKGRDFRKADVTFLTKR